MLGIQRPTQSGDTLDTATSTEDSGVNFRLMNRLMDNLPSYWVSSWLTQHLSMLEKCKRSNLFFYELIFKL